MSLRCTMEQLEYNEKFHSFLNLAELFKDVQGIFTKKSYFMCVVCDGMVLGKAHRENLFK